MRNPFKRTAKPTSLPPRPITTALWWLSIQAERLPVALAWNPPLKIVPRIRGLAGRAARRWL